MSTLGTLTTTCTKSGAPSGARQVSTTKGERMATAKKPRAKVTTTKTEDNPQPPYLWVLAVICWILPLMGLAFGSGQWWQYLIWLAIGTYVMSKVVVVRVTES